VGDGVGAALAGLRGLTVLSLAETRAGDGAVAALAGLRLRALDLRASAVGDGALPALARLPLRRLDVRRTRVTRAAAATLHKRLGDGFLWGGAPLVERPGTR
jgi:hypothetical protein